MSTSSKLHDRHAPVACSLEAGGPYGTIIGDKSKQEYGILCHKSMDLEYDE